MYFPGTKLANKLPKICEAEITPVIQPNAATLLSSSTTSAYQQVILIWAYVKYSLTLIN